MKSNIDSNRENILIFDNFLRESIKNFTYHGLMNRPEEKEWIAHSFMTDIISSEENFTPDIFKKMLKEINDKFPNQDIKLFGFEMKKTIINDDDTKIDPVTGIILSYNPKSVKNILIMRLGFKK